MREDYRHFGARSTVKIGPAKRNHTAGHHVNAKTDLRAGIVKARRPRVRAGGAKRRALHGAEHRCSIVVVMADGIDATPDVITSRWSQVDIECDAREPPFPGRQLAATHAPNVTWLRATFSGTNRTGLSGRSESQSSAFDAANTLRFSPSNMLCPTT